MDRSNQKNLLTLTEEVIIVLSIVKWVVLSAIIGAVVGAFTSLFLKILDLSISFGGSFSYFFLLLPVVMFSNILITHFLAPDSEGHGTEKVIESFHKRSGFIRLRVLPVKFITTIATLATGGSVGKEGPCAQMGAAISSFFSTLFRFDSSDRKKLVVCGISAGFAAVFGTPIAGAIFGVEVLFVGSILYDVLLPSFVAGMIAFQVATAFGTTFHYSPIEFLPDFSILFFMKIVLAGLFFGICSFLFIEILRLGKVFASKINVYKPLKGFIGGLSIILIALVFSKDYLGLGIDTIEHALAGQQVVWYAFLMKAIVTSITLSFGGSGGVVTPIFFIGATSGILFATLMGLSTSTFAALGLVSLLAGAANTPLAACIMAVELFGSPIAPYATIACVVSFLVTGYRSAFHSQVLKVNKSPSILAETDHEMDDKHTHFNYGARRMIVKGMKITRKISKVKIL